jgi:hypothetical protein
MPDNAPGGRDGAPRGPRPRRRQPRPARHFGRRMLLAMALVVVAGFVVGLLLPIAR